MRPEALLGRVVLGTYHVRELLGEGGFAWVYRAEDGAGHSVALKVLIPLPRGVYSEALLERFAREARLLGRLGHPNTVRFIERGEELLEEGKLLSLLVTEFIDGVTLERHLADHGAMHPASVRALLLAVLQSLAEAHDVGVVHRDIKPSNIMLVEYDRRDPDTMQLKVVDYGVAKIIDSIADARALNGFTTRGGEPQTTPAYCPPEHIRGARPHPSMDIYSLGMTALEALQGTHPYAGLSYDRLLATILSSESLALDTEHPLLRVLELMVCKEPARRPQSGRTAMEIARAIVLR